MLATVFPVQQHNRSGIITAVLLFIMQFLYYQWQDVWLEVLWTVFPAWPGLQVPLIPDFTLEKAAILLHILVHTLFSMVIVWFLHKNRQSVRFVVYLSLLLFAAYLVTHFLGKAFDWLILSIISTQIYLFIASPFKTIFSIPTLKLK